MPDRSPRRPDLRASVPTLEPDDAFVARLSALAAGGAPAPATARRPIGTWQMAFAAAGVAAVLVGVAWLAGLSPGGTPSPAPPATNTPSAPGHTPTTPPSPTGQTTATESQPLSSPETVAATTSTGRPNHGPSHGSTATDHEHATAGADDNAPADDNAGSDEKVDHGRGPNAHAGDHPNAHSTTKSNHANQHPGTPPDRGNGSAEDRSGR